MNDGVATQTRREPKGAVEHTGANAKYLFIKYGCLCETSKTAVDGWTHPTHQKTGEVITDKWVKVYKSLEAWMNKLEWYDRKHGEEIYQGWKLHLSAGGTTYILDLPLNNEATKKFMMSARNLNFDLPLEIAAWTSREDGKLAVWLKQDGQTVLQYYKKGDMHECPEPVQRPAIGGKVKWDWSETDAYLWKEMEDVIAKHIERSAEDRGYEQQQQQPTPDTPDYSGPAGAVPDHPEVVEESHPQGCRCADCYTGSPAAPLPPDDDIPF